KVHLDKLKRLGVPVFLSHTVVRAEGRGKLEGITIAEIDKTFQPIEGTERSWDVDTLLIAVGLSSVNELAEKARQYGIPVFLAGDSEEIAEASAAMFSGRIAGRRIASQMGLDAEIPGEWNVTAEVLRSKPGKIFPFKIKKFPDLKVKPIIRCIEEIPCNPCTQVCPLDSIVIPDGTIMGLPEFDGGCLGCGRCVLVCPGLAITLLVEDYDPKKKKALIMMPFEFEESDLVMPQEVRTVGMEGEVVGTGVVVAIRNSEEQDRRRLLMVEVPWKDRYKVAGFRIQEPEQALEAKLSEEEDPIVCRCERIRKSAIVDQIKAGTKDLNELKSMSRASMGGCGGKTCQELVLRIYRELGIDPRNVAPATKRPFVAEVPLGVYASAKDKKP
ncbi:(2Fe-2S)-binding protein, partial [Acidobacteriota bacterium]